MGFGEIDRKPVYKIWSRTYDRYVTCSVAGGSSEDIEFDSQELCQALIARLKKGSRTQDMGPYEVHQISVVFVESE